MLVEKRFKTFAFWKQAIKLIRFLGELIYAFKNKLQFISYQGNFRINYVFQTNRKGYN
jgi:hypothetical protein